MTHDERNDDRVAGEFDGPPTDAEVRAIERWGDAIDAAARGELDADALSRLEREAEHDGWLREALADARAVREHANALPRFDAPPALDARILKAIDLDRPAPRRAPSPAPRRALRWVATATVAAAAALALLIGGPSTPEPAVYVAADGTTFTEGEVREALQEMETALAMLNGNLDRTGSILRREMQSELHDHLTVPIERSFGKTVDSIPFLRGDAQDDQHSGVRPPTGERPLRSHALPGAFHAERT